RDERADAARAQVVTLRAVGGSDVLRELLAHDGLCEEEAATHGEAEPAVAPHEPGEVDLGEGAEAGPAVGDLLQRVVSPGRLCEVDADTAAEPRERPQRHLQRT